MLYVELGIVPYDEPLTDVEVLASIAGYHMYRVGLLDRAWVYWKHLGRRLVDIRRPRSCRSLPAWLRLLAAPWNSQALECALGCAALTYRTRRRP
jgi:hypothetical protein